MEKWPCSDQNHGLTPLEKSQFFDFLNVLFLQPRKAVFVLEYHKRHFPGLNSLKRKLEKWSFCEQNDGLTPFEKCHFFDFQIFLFFQRRKAVFSIQNIVNTFYWPILPKKKSSKNGQIYVQNRGLNPLEKPQFFGRF